MKKEATPRSGVNFATAGATALPSNVRVHSLSEQLVWLSTYFNGSNAGLSPYKFNLIFNYTYTHNYFYSYS